jgi:hypothetical protein
MKKVLSYIIILVLTINLFISTTSSLDFKNEIYIFPEDYDPLVDINITIEILAIRAFDRIDLFSDPDFFLKVYINDEVFKSKIWKNSKSVYDCWKFSTNVPDDIENVKIRIELWDSNLLRNRLCDISSEKKYENDGRTLDLLYNIGTGIWSGDDYNTGDSSGYGRGCGTGDGSIYKDEDDCEIIFNIYQNDFDNDNLPYWIETNIYGTDPEVNNIGEDLDEDLVPIEWEHRFGFNPLVWEDHENFDHDADSLNNTEEYNTSRFGSDPFRPDIFLEVDYMRYENSSEPIDLFEKVREIIKNPYHKRNILFHIDIGEVDGGDEIPPENESSFEEILEIYRNYFTHNGEQSWKRGIYHYALIVEYCRPGGYAFSGDVKPHWGYNPGTNCFVLNKQSIEKKSNQFRKNEEYIISHLFMHEMGHNFGIRFGNPLGCDNQGSDNPLRPSFWLFRNYKSVMNYRYTYLLMDYSDGSHGKRDFDDWEAIDLKWFEYVNTDPVDESQNLK